MQKFNPTENGPEEKVLKEALNRKPRIINAACQVEVVHSAAVTAHLNCERQRDSVRIIRGTAPYRRQRRSVNAGNPGHASGEDVKARGFTRNAEIEITEEDVQFTLPAPLETAGRET